MKICCLLLSALLAVVIPATQPLPHKLIGDFEGITYDPATGLIYVGVEGEEKILELDPDRLEVRREFSIPRTFRGATVMKAGGQGIEALAFLPTRKTRTAGRSSWPTSASTSSSPRTARPSSS